MTATVSHQGTPTTWDYHCNDCDARIIDSDPTEIIDHGWWLLAGTTNLGEEQEDRHFCSVACFLNWAYIECPQRDAEHFMWETRHGS